MWNRKHTVTPSIVCSEILKQSRSKILWNQIESRSVSVRHLCTPKISHCVEIKIVRSTCRTAKHPEIVLIAEHNTYRYGIFWTLYIVESLYENKERKWISNIIKYNEKNVLNYISIDKIWTHQILAIRYTWSLSVDQLTYRHVMCSICPYSACIWKSPCLNHCI